MLVAIALGMGAANSPLSGVYDFIHHYPLRLGIAPVVIDAPLIDWINQGLLVVFFFHIGLHTKQEMTSGVLAARGRATLPAIAAFGGMAVPAAIYLAFNAGDPEAMRGWAIPIATDVVLVLGLMSFLGPAVSVGLLAFVTAVAIFDDLGAVLVIALFYGESEFGWSLALIAVGLAGLWALNQRASEATMLYLLAGALLWSGLIGSGLEGAIAGAIIGLALPLSAFRLSAVAQVEHRVAPLALFIVVPIFAFFNAGVPLTHASCELDDRYGRCRNCPGPRCRKAVGCRIGNRPCPVGGSGQLAVRDIFARYPARRTFRRHRFHDELVHRHRRAG